MMRTKAAASRPVINLPAAQLRELNERQADQALAQEKYAHALTRAELVKHAAEAAAARAEVAARDAREQAQARAREAKADFEAAQKQLADLTAEIRRTHNLTDKHAIDGVTGAIVHPES